MCTRAAGSGPGELGEAALGVGLTVLGAPDLAQRRHQPQVPKMAATADEAAAPRRFRSDRNPTHGS